MFLYCKRVLPFILHKDAWARTAPTARNLQSQLAAAVGDLDGATLFIRTRAQRLFGALHRGLGARNVDLLGARS